MIEIREGGLDDRRVQGLLAHHLADAHSDTPPGFRHALDLGGLRDPAITFWSAWDGETLLGVAALRALTPMHGEIKSMRTAPEHLRRGVGRALLNHIMRAARDRGHTRLSLETGTSPMFDPANRLYENFGFVDGPVFGGYPPSPHNRFMHMTF